MALPQNYSPKEYEQKIYESWMESGVGNVEKQQLIQSLTEDTQTHSILMPPPNLTGNMHAGHAFQHFLMDTLSRINRQNGVLDLWFPGVDHAGIQLEGVIDKLIKKGEFDEEIKTKINTEKLKVKNETVEQLLDLIETKKREDLPKLIKKNYPELWTELAWSKVNLWRNNQKNQAKVLGDTPDYSRNLFTLDDKANNMVNFAFKKYWEDDLIYRGAYLVNWSVGLQTAVSDMAGEIEYTTRKDPFVTFEYRTDFQASNFGLGKFKSDGKKEHVLSFAITKFKVSTVRPETIFGDVGLMINRKVFKERLLSYKSQTWGSLTQFDVDDICTDIDDGVFDINYGILDLNINNIKLILGDDDEVDPNFGTGALKITPASDQHDYDIFNKYIGGEFPRAIGRDGKLSEICGEFAGLTVEQGRLAVIKRLAETGYIPVVTEFKDESIQILSEVKSNLESESFNPADYSYEEGIKRLQEIMGETGQKLQIDWNYEHNVTICERSKTVIEPLISEEFFIDYTKSIEINNQTTSLQKLGLEGLDEVQYFSSDYKNRAINFVENIKNWCISRDLTWGHRFPVWYNLDVNPEKKFYSVKELGEQESPLKRGEPKARGVLPVLPYNPKLIEKAKELRKNSSKAEIRFWSEIKNDLELSKIDFHRQKPILEYIVDFFVPAFNLVIELDGDTHNYQIEYDNQRTAKLEELDLKVLRFTNENIKNNLDGVFDEIKKYISELKTHPVSRADTPLQRGLESSLEFQVHYNSSEQTNLPLKIQAQKPNEPGNWVQEDKILDTWFSSCLWPLSTLGFVENLDTEILKQVQDDKNININTDFTKFYPTSEMVTGGDIFYIWVVRMIILGKYFTGKIPFQKVIINPTVLDEKGRKMSKSLGNGLDPVEAIDKFSSDSLRLGMLSGMIPGRNMKMGGKIADNLMEKYRNFGNKLWNVARFLENQEGQKDI